jgi:dihydrofolate reductase
LAKATGRTVPTETKFRFEFHDEVDGRTRLEIHQWLPEHLTGPSEDGWLTVGGAQLAAQALKAGLVDECRLFVWPVILGGGKPALPSGDRGDLELLDERRFGNGFVHLRYRIPT